MSREIAIERLRPHPLNANVMPEALLGKLRRHIARTGRYEPLVVRPLRRGADGPDYQVLNGHHRLEALKALGHSAVLCEVWDVDDREALVLLATLNRLEGRDDPSRRAALVSRLAGAEGEAALQKLARLLPENRSALQKALALAREPLPMPVLPEASPAVPRPMTFFLDGGQHDVVNRALKIAGRTVSGNDATDGGTEGEIGREARRRHAPRGRARARALVALARHYLSAAGTGVQHSVAAPRGE